MAKIKFIKIFTLIAFFNISTFLLISSVNAQFQVGEFSGNNINSYQCFDQDGNSEPPAGEQYRDSSGYFLCNCFNGNPPSATTDRCPGNPSECDGTPGSAGCVAARAVLKPPTLQQLEIWFVRIIYIVWALVATLSVFYLVLLGYRYMITRGDVTKITEIRQKIIYYIVGVVVVFLAVPILSTVFRLLGVNERVDCYNVNLSEIGFQFFFTDLCTAPNILYYCDNPDEFESGLACQEIGGASTVRCPNQLDNGNQYVFTCSTSAGGDRQTWIRYELPYRAP